MLLFEEASLRFGDFDEIDAGTFGALLYHLPTSLSTSV